MYTCIMYRATVLDVENSLRSFNMYLLLIYVVGMNATIEMVQPGNKYSTYCVVFLCISTVDSIIMW